jgi:diguanylate cyclase (GGDEF)-like protein/PAS domain S-box-containing protein
MESRHDDHKVLELVMAGAALGYWDWNFKAGDHRVNDRWLEMLGLERDDLTGRDSDWFERIHAGDKSRVMTAIEDHIARGETFVIEYRMQHKDGYWVWIQGSGGVVEYDEAGDPLRLCGTHQDISSRKRVESERDELISSLQQALDTVAETNMELQSQIAQKEFLQKQLAHRAMHDYLTELPNKALLIEQAEQILSMAKRHKDMLGVLFINLDHFKNINDELGHGKGNAALVEFSIKLSEAVRNCDIVARWGGDEFVAILPHCHSLADIRQVAERILQKCAAGLESIQGMRLTTSIGISVFPDHAENLSRLIAIADTAMDAAQAEGGNRYRIGDGLMKELVFGSA